MTMEWFVAGALSALIIIGSIFSFLAALGINRLPDMYCRMHAASKAGTIGSGILLIAAGIHSFDYAIFARSVAGFFFLLLTAPVAAHLLARSSYIVGYKMNDASVVDDML
jgi:multicomponent Na+:H+ antiporter subunit G